MTPEPGETYTPYDTNVVIGYTSLPQASSHGKLCALLMPIYEPETNLLWTEPAVDDPETDIDESTYAPRETWTYRPFLVNIGGNRVALLSQVLWFDASVSQGDAGLVPTVATWNFGDGNTAEGLLVSHTYASAGSYTVTCVIEGRTTRRYVRVLSALGESDLDVVNVESFGASTEGWKVTLKVRDDVEIDNFQGILLYVYDDTDVSWRALYDASARELARNTSYGTDLPPDAIWYDTANGNTTPGNGSIGRVGSPEGGCWTEVNKYNDTFERVSLAHSVPANLLKAIAYVKSCGEDNVVFDTTNEECPQSIGIMQVICGGNDHYDPEVSISAAGELLARYYKTCGTWEGAINYYVAGHCICDGTVDYFGTPDCDYTENIITFWREADNEAGIGGGYDGPLYGEVIFNGYITDVNVDKDANTSFRTIICENTASVLNLLTKRREIFFENARLASAGGTVLSQPMRTATCIHHLLTEHTDFPEFHDVILDWSGPRFSSTTANEGSLWSNLTEWARNDFSDVWGDRHGKLRYSLKPNYRGKVWYDQTQALWIDPSLVLEAQVTERHAEKTTWVKLAGMLAGGSCEIYGEFPCGGPPENSGGKWLVQRGFQYDDWRVLCAMAAHEYAYQNRRYDIQFTTPWRHDLEIQDIITLPLVDKSGRFNWSSVRPKFVITSISHQYDNNKATWLTTITAEELTFGIPCGCPRPHCPNTDIPTDLPHLPGLPNLPGFPPIPGGDCWGVCDGETGTPCSGDTNETMKWYRYAGQYKNGTNSSIEGDESDHYTSERSGDFCSGYTYEWNEFDYALGPPLGATIAIDVPLGPPDGYPLNTGHGNKTSYVSTDPFVFNRSADGGTKPILVSVNYDDYLVENTTELETSTLTALNRFTHITDNHGGETFDIEDTSTWVQITVYSPEGMARIGELWIRSVGDIIGEIFLVAQEVKDHHDPPIGIDTPTVELLGTTNLFGLSQEYTAHLNNPLRKDDTFILKRLNSMSNDVPEGRGVFGGQNDNEINHDDGSWTKMAFSLPGSPTGKTYRIGLLADQATADTSETSDCERTFVCLERKVIDDYCLTSGEHASSIEEIYYTRDVTSCDANIEDYCWLRSVQIPRQYLLPGSYGQDLSDQWPYNTYSTLNSWPLEMTWPGKVIDFDEPLNLTGGYSIAEVSTSGFIDPFYGEKDRRLYHINNPYERLQSGGTFTPYLTYSTVPPFTNTANPIKRSITWELADNDTNETATQLAEVSGSYQLMLAWTSCGVSNPSGPWVGPWVPVADGENLPGTCTNWPSATKINQLIEEAQKQNGRTGILDGTGEMFITRGQQYGINPGFVASIALLATQFGTDGSEANSLSNNPFRLNGTGNCGSYGELARYCNGNDAISGCFDLLDGSTFRSTDGTLNEIIAHFFSPYPESWDQLAIAAGQLGITLGPDTQLYTTDPLCLNGALNAPSPGTMGGFNTALEYSLHSANGAVSQGPFGIWSHSVCDCYDFSIPEGTLIYSVSSGTVIESEATAGVYEPNTIVVETEYGNIRYAHLTDRFVEVGDTVTNTTLLGYSGTAGTGPHLHLGLDGGSGASPKGYTLTQTLQALGFNLGGFPWVG